MVNLRYYKKNPLKKYIYIYILILFSKCCFLGGLVFGLVSNNGYIYEFRQTFTRLPHW